MFDIPHISSPPPLSFPLTLFLFPSLSYLLPLLVRARDMFLGFYRITITRTYIFFIGGVIMRTQKRSDCTSPKKHKYTTMPTVENNKKEQGKRNEKTREECNASPMCESDAPLGGIFLISPSELQPLPSQL